MRMHSSLLFPLFWISMVVSAVSEDWTIISHSTGLSLRGLHPVNEELAWACGSQGTVLKITERGKQVKRCSIQGMEKSDFRSIFAWDANRCLVATAGQPAILYKTTDGGTTWRSVFQSGAAESFFNGMKFLDAQRGVVFGDPIRGRLELLVTTDEGETWRVLPPVDSPAMEMGEAGFAASNSSMVVYDGNIWIGLGGKQGKARVLRCTIPDFQTSGESVWTWEPKEISSIPSGASQGIFSIAFSATTGWLVGGDYKDPDKREGNCSRSLDRGMTWEKSSSNPTGFRSCVTYSPQHDLWIAVGPNGTDALKGNQGWERFSNIGFHSVYATSNGVFWACGSDGRIGRLDANKVILPRK